MKMTNFIIKLSLMLFMVGLMFSPGICIAQQLSQDPLYRLVFEDNFDTIDYSKWRTSWYWGNNMFNTNKNKTKCPGFADSIMDWAYNTQYPNDSNRMIINSGGGSFERLIFDREDFYAPMLVYYRPCPSPVCSAHAAPCTNAGSDSNYCIYDSLVPYKFSGAMLMGLEKFKYGYFEIRYTISNYSALPSNSYGPNFWMWESDNSAFYSEIDIFEQRGSDWRMGMNLHYRHLNPDSSNEWEDTVQWNGIGDSIDLTNPYPNLVDQSRTYDGRSWHTVGCEWTPDHVDTYYDSDDTTRRFSILKLPIIDNLTAMPLIIDCYMPCATYCIRFSDTNTRIPFRYDIDYVRVYQINQVDSCSTTSGYFPSFAPNDYNSILYRDLTIGGGGSAILNSGSFHLAGQDFVLLQNGFEVSGSATVAISTTPCQPGQRIDTTISRLTYIPPDSCIMNDLLKVKHGR